MDSTRLLNGSTPNRYMNTPSPVVFPSASPTPKLFGTPSKKLPEVHSWQGLESVPRNSPTQIYQHDDSAIIYNSGDYHQRNHSYNHYNSREKGPSYPNATPAISPLSMLLESDTLLDDEDISSYRFSEEDYLSSIISSRPPSSLSASPLRRRPVSFCSPSPSLSTGNTDEFDGPIIGIPFAPVPNDDPIMERPRRFSLDRPVSSEQNVPSTTKFGGFGKNFLSRMKKAASGKQ